MAYQQSTISSLADIPAIVAAFASGKGWTVSGNTFRRADDSSATVFTLAADIQSTDHWLRVTASGAPRAMIRSPKLNGTAAVPQIPLPTSLHLFASATPQPYIAIVVQYDYNRYRHLYIGNVVKFGAYTGGECISGTNVYASNNGFDRYPISYRFDTGHLFQASSRTMAAADSGGIRVQHANNPTTWRQFFGTDNYNPMGQFDTTTVLGGFGDDINDGYVARGQSPFAGVSILTPINLYASMPVTGDTVFVPVGYPAGVRLVNMEDFDPGVTITVGDSQWMVFPAISKNPVLDAPKSATGWAQFETSGMVGYAYPVA